MNWEAWCYQAPVLDKRASQSECHLDDWEGQEGTSNTGKS